MTAVAVATAAPSATPAPITFDRADRDMTPPDMLHVSNSGAYPPKPGTGGSVSDLSVRRCRTQHSVGAITEAMRIVAYGSSTDASSRGVAVSGLRGAQGFEALGAAAEAF